MKVVLPTQNDQGTLRKLRSFETLLSGLCSSWDCRTTWLFLLVWNTIVSNTHTNGASTIIHFCCLFWKHSSQQLLFHTMTPQDWEDEAHSDASGHVSTTLEHVRIHSSQAHYQNRKQKAGEGKNWNDIYFFLNHPSSTAF